MNYILFNKKSQNGHSEAVLKEIEKEYAGKDIQLIDVIAMSDNYDKLFSTLTKEDEVVLVGGDGTLNHFINIVYGKTLPCDFYFYAGGTGNDFLHDVSDIAVGRKILVNDLIKDLPYVIVNEKKYYFINGVGYGIDGYCCEVGDREQAKSDKPVNYTSIAIKGLLFHYKAPNATITIDGVTKKYKKVWLAPTMKGRYYGGGMMVAPKQDRNDKDHLVTNVVLYKAGKLRALMAFPSIFKGELQKNTKIVDERQGKDIYVEFDRPTALQIDGETIKNVTKYEVHIK